MVDLVNLEQDRLDDVVSDELEIRVVEMVHHVLLPSGEEIVDNDDAVPPRDEAVHEVAPHEPRPACDHNAEPLRLEPKRNLPPDVEPPRGSLDRGAVGMVAAVEVSRLRGYPYVAIGVERGGGEARGEKEKKGGGEGHTEEEEKGALLAEEVTEGAGETVEGLHRLCGVLSCYGRRGGVVAAADELGGHGDGRVEEEAPKQEEKGGGRLYVGVAESGKMVNLMVHRRRERVALGGSSGNFLFSIYLKRKG